MAEQARKRWRTRELALRLVSAAVLIPFGLFVVWTGGVVLALACAGFAAVMGYEWARMTASPIMPAMVAACGLPSLAAFLPGILPAAIALGVSAIAMAALHPGTRQDRYIAAFGAVYAASMPMALFLLRDGEWDGQAAALILMGIVWGSDTAAYFTGRAIGGPKLAPRESPSKTWSGAAGGVLFSALCGLIAAYLESAWWLPWFIAGALISISAQWGDLFESSMKRRFGVKDSGDLLPGHGGIMDRVDGLGVACILAVVVLGFPFGVEQQLGLAS